MEEAQSGAFECVCVCVVFSVLSAEELWWLNSKSICLVHGSISDLFIHTTQGSELITKQISPPSDKIDTPVIAFIALERYNALRLVQTVHSSLAALNKVLRGSSLLTPSVQKMASYLLKSEVGLLILGSSYLDLTFLLILGLSLRYD